MSLHYFLATTLTLTLLLPTLLHASLTFPPNYLPQLLLHQIGPVPSPEPVLYDVAYTPGPFPESSVEPDPSFFPPPPCKRSRPQITTNKTTIQECQPGNVGRVLTISILNGCDAGVFGIIFCGPPGSAQAPLQRTSNCLFKTVRSDCKGTRAFIAVNCWKKSVRSCNRGVLFSESVFVG